MGDDDEASWPAAVVRTTGSAGWAVVHSWTRDVRLVVHTNWMGVARQPDMGHPMKHFAMELHSCWTERS